jgi:hypothetical protein
METEEGELKQLVGEFEFMTTQAGFCSIYTKEDEISNYLKLSRGFVLYIQKKMKLVSI